MLNEYQDELKEGLRMVSQKAQEREEYEERDPLVRTLTHLYFLEEMLTLDDLNMLPHLLKTRGTSIKFYPKSFQRLCSLIKGQESPHFAIRHESFLVASELSVMRVWKRSMDGLPLYVPAEANVVIELDKLGYHHDLVNYFGSRRLPEIANSLHDQVVKILSSPNKYAQTTPRIA
jgi:hypothetical protein